MREDTTSGIEVPAAMNVSPITESGILRVWPRKEKEKQKELKLE